MLVQNWLKETALGTTGVRKAKEQRGLPEPCSEESKHLTIGTGSPDCNEVRARLCVDRDNAL